MFCEKCGKSNPNDAVFCEGCGARVSAPPPPVQQQQVVRPVAPPPRKTAAEKKAAAAEKAAQFKKKVKNLPKKVWVLSGAGVAVLLAFFIFLGVGKSVTSPKTIAKQYFKAMYVDRNVEKAFDYLLLETSEFVNEKTLAAYLEDDVKDRPQVVKFVVEAPQKNRYRRGLARWVEDLIEGNSGYSSNENDTMTQTVTVNYNTTNGENNRESIQLFDTGKRSLLLWKKYAVSMNLDRVINKNVQIVVPKGSTVTVDGIALKNPSAAEKDGYGYRADSVDIFTIDSIFDTEHKIVVMNPAFEEYETEDSLRSNGTAEYLRLELTQATRDTLFEKTKTITQNAIISKLAGKEFGSLSLDLTADTSEVERVKYSYDNAFSSYTSIKPKTFEDGSSSNDLGGNMRYSCRINYVADCVYSSWGGEQTSERNLYATITYAYENGAWVVAAASF